MKIVMASLMKKLSVTMVKSAERATVLILAQIANVLGGEPVLMVSANRSA
jgi:hypothetical protein